MDVGMLQWYQKSDIIETKALLICVVMTRSAKISEFWFFKVYIKRSLPNWEITIIAAEPTSLPSDAASEIGGKAVELESYMDPTKEEFVQYTHIGDPVDVTFGVKEFKVNRYYDLGSGLLLFFFQNLNVKSLCLEV
ncbi:uncharacterized protein LOC120009856 isoform X2 [Tripterygium wilfordii]|uniref:uncharacterized protein LOC120009856 isoform X2 n=1 Tax=Tripterygium wilfordii TaxID=458696 RepID=UPI0018F82091|nr:uncharacterized protein LOC120009856 isoform X2 [Tripterygium wilfordii]XP_038716508.1 uncharacterized protein LOC120009856 isoform X2 [Tripterygium wilfordii]